MTVRSAHRPYGLLPANMRTHTTENGVSVKLKDDSVDVGSLAPGVLEQVVEAARPQYAKRRNLENLVITSAHDGTHSDNSLHDDGLAVDLRTWGFSNAQARRVTTGIQAALGEKWDVVYEVDHIHIEFDPPE
jgi:hypothetical protein